MSLKFPVASSLQPIALFIACLLAPVFPSLAAPDERLVEVTPDNLPGVVLEMRYATEKNITGKPIYADGKAWLRLETIRKLAKVAGALEEKGYRLVIWDAWRGRIAFGKCFTSDWFEHVLFYQCFSGRRRRIISCGLCDEYRDAHRPHRQRFCQYRP